MQYHETPKNKAPADKTRLSVVMVSCSLNMGGMPIILLMGMKKMLLRAFLCPHGMATGL